MSVVIETTLGDITVDLLLVDRPKACLNFLKLCKMKYYNYNLFHTLSRGFIAQTGDPTGTRSGGESIFGVIEGPAKRYFEAENEPRIKHTRPGLISFVGDEDHMIASQFFLTLGDDLTYLDEKHCVFGEVVEGFDVLETINEVICDRDDRPYQDVRITHTVVLDDPYPDPKGFKIPSRSPSPSAERLAGGRIAPDEEIDETLGKTSKEIAEMQAEREAKARATILEMVGDIPDADMAPPENVLFVCKLNPVTSDDDLEIIFSRFGKIKSCEVIRDKKTGDSLQYAFIEFEEQKACEDAYFKMDNVLVDDRRIHVDFSQSVSKIKWHGKGRGVTHFDEDGNKRKGDMNNEIGKGNYKIKNGSGYKDNKKESERKSRSPRRHKDRNSSPKRLEDVREKRKSRSPRRKQTSQSPERRSKGNRSPTWNRRKSRSPKHSRNRSRSPVRRRNDNRSPARTPPRRYDRRRWSRSPRYNWRRNERRYSPKRNSSSFIPKSRSNRRSVWSPYQSKRNPTTRRNSDSPKRRSTSHTSRSPSPSRKGTDMWEKANQLLKGKESKLSTLTDLSKIEIRRQRISSQRSISSGKTLESPRKRSESPIDVLVAQRNSKGLQGEQNSPKYSKDRENVSSSNNTSQSPRRSHSRLIEENTKTEERYLKTEIKKLTSDIGENKPGKEKLSSEHTVLTEKARSKDKVKKTKKSSKKKKSKKYDSSEESDTDSEQDRRKSKKKKSKKKVESSSDSSSSEESTSSSDEEIIKKKGSKKRSKKKVRDRKSKKSKRRKSSSSSSSDSSSDSESSNSSSSSSSSSESEKDNYKKKKLKKIQKTKNNSESD